MSPITHAYIKYWLITASYIPKALALAGRASWYQHKINNYVHVAEFERHQQKMNEIQAEVKRMVTKRWDAVRLEYRARLNDVVEPKEM